MLTVAQAALNGVAFARRHQQAAIVFIPKAASMTREKAQQARSYRPLALTPAMQHLIAEIALRSLQRVTALPWRAGSFNNYAGPGTDAHDMAHAVAARAETALLHGRQQLWVVANDLTNAFGTLGREFLQAALRVLNVPARLRQLVHRMYEGMTLRARI